MPNNKSDVFVERACLDTSSSAVICKVNLALSQNDGKFCEMRATDALFCGNHSFILILSVYICLARVHQAHLGPCFPTHLLYSSMHFLLP